MYIRPGKVPRAAYRVTMTTLWLQGVIMENGLYVFKIQSSKSDYSAKCDFRCKPWYIFYQVIVGPTIFPDKNSKNKQSTLLKLIKDSFNSNSLFLRSSHLESIIVLFLFSSSRFAANFSSASIRSRRACSISTWGVGRATSHTGYFLFAKQIASLIQSLNLSFL